MESSPFTASYNLNIDRKSDEIAFISGIIEFRNGSVLDSCSDDHCEFFFSLQQKTD
jgi:hypothetical protein